MKDQVSETMGNASETGGAVATTARLTFGDIGTTVTVPAGTRIVDIAERLGAGITTGCREGDCGSCLVRIEAGAEGLSEPSALELQVLRDAMAGRNDRLACQCRILSGHVTLRPG